MHEELRRRRWTEQDLSKRRKTNAEKVKLAARLRAETVMTWDWIAARLRMGSVAHLNTLLNHWRKGVKK